MPESSCCFRRDMPGEELVMNVLRPVSSDRSANSPVTAAVRGDAMMVAVV